MSEPGEGEGEGAVGEGVEGAGVVEGKSDTESRLLALEKRLAQTEARLVQSESLSNHLLTQLNDLKGTKKELKEKMIKKPQFRKGNLRRRCGRGKRRRKENNSTLFCQCY